MGTVTVESADLSGTGDCTGSPSGAGQRDRIRKHADRIHKPIILKQRFSMMGLQIFSVPVAFTVLYHRLLCVCSRVQSQAFSLLLSTFLSSPTWATFLANYHTTARLYGSSRPQRLVFFRLTQG